MLTKEKILDASEIVLRKFGPRKTTVVDVARALDVSHGTVYRHFATKAELHEAITLRWLDRVTAPLTEITNRPESASLRLREWFEALTAIKRRIFIGEPELFESYSSLTQQTPEHVKSKHINHLLQQVESILNDGVREGVFEIKDCTITARCFFFGTVRYHHPLHSPEWKSDTIEQEFTQLFSLLEKAIYKH
ncbi:MULTISPECIES: TetR family transcriptional regulator [Vibrio]|uniref:TetR family transcriptional regulator n=1 Tax=Vibrio tasmaniensis TaxID=212663 RepID=A0A2N7NBW0_9VIBR|nr:TetR family transcriptional regulator [Vibrio tasmaniensis]PMP08181.1 TetR family transcriptional regulator [Vibrio tasmaniensis]TKG36804.1 TetR/AcrR family transcriptional regulator [Vibrio tasmaniensis]TKG38654.1 TetR/AcrR family transcriptional regulator [Vibrio tasmaniensis]TKG51719.1 TetR/AcrR family transcriptional regulator [Vibrio tasmaniensis]TKG52452.1 TetR/AcrR family transcriptional regulator [Vibrio tasmaniensis]